MEFNTVTISELASGMLNEARRLGFSESTLWQSWGSKTNSVIAYYRKRGLYAYSPETTEDYLLSCEQRYEAGELSHSTIQTIRQIIRRLHEYYLTGTLRTAGNTRISNYCRLVVAATLFYFNSCFGNLFIQFGNVYFRFPERRVAVLFVLQKLLQFGLDL